MASKSKKSSSSKKTKKRKNTGAGESFVIDEVIIWVTLAVSILLLISNFGFGGKVGSAISAWCMEACGAVAYLLPFLLFGVIAFLVSNKHNAVAYWKSAGIIIFFGLLTGLFEMISKAGGALGETVAGMMTPAFGVDRYICASDHPDDHLYGGHYGEIRFEGHEAAQRQGLS